MRPAARSAEVASLRTDPRDAICVMLALRKRKTKPDAELAGEDPQALVSRASPFCAEPQRSRVRLETALAVPISVAQAFIELGQRLGLSQLDRALKVTRSLDIRRARERDLGRAGEPPRGLCARGGELGDVLERSDVGSRLAPVVRNQLDKGLLASRGELLQPARRGSVEPGALSARQHPVRYVADEDVAKGEGVRACCSDEIPVEQRAHGLGRVADRRIEHEDLREAKRPAENGAELQDAPFARCQEIETREHRRLDGVWERCERALDRSLIVE